MLLQQLQFPVVAKAQKAARWEQTLAQASFAAQK
jgi:hypothetical protein